MDIDRVHHDINTHAVRRPGRVSSWIIAAIGIHILLASVASASDVSMTNVERTKVRRISESVVQVLRELVERTPALDRREPSDPGFRLVESALRIDVRTHEIVQIRMLDERVMDLPPPACA